MPGRLSGSTWRSRRLAPIERTFSSMPPNSVSTVDAGMRRLQATPYVRCQAVAFAPRGEQNDGLARTADANSVALLERGGHQPLGRRPRETVRALRIPRGHEIAVVPVVVASRVDSAQYAATQEQMGLACWIASPWRQIHG